jgi:hypothetical protein
MHLSPPSDAVFYAEGRARTNDPTKFAGKNSSEIGMQGVTLAAMVKATPT